MNKNPQGLVMDNDYVSLPVTGIVTLKVEDLQILRTKKFAEVVLRADHCALIHCQRIVTGDELLLKTGDEIITIDIQPSVSQRPKVDIRYTERLSIVFDNTDRAVPTVFALRKSFPKVLHRLAVYFAEPVALCIYEETFTELKLKWRSSRFLSDIKSWLELTAVGKLHQIDQPLEPLLLGSYGTLIFPAGLEERDNVCVQLRSKKNGQFHFAVTRNLSSDNNFLFLFISGKVQDHGIMDTTPRAIKDLCDFLKRAGIDFYTAIKASIREAIDNKAQLTCKLMLLVQLPKKDNSGKIENDLYAFLTHDDVMSIGKCLNLWSDGPAGLGFVYPEIIPDDAALSASIISILTPHILLNPENCAYFSGNTSSGDLQLTQIGVGALGSQIFSNFHKTGFGRWNLIDKDILLPHNTVRHHLHQKFVGWPKSVALAQEANEGFDSIAFANGVWDDYLQPQMEDDLNAALKDADIIIDASASIAVARKLAADKKFKAKRISVFLSPSGKDLVVLGEDSDRKVTLDMLEFLYYQALIENNNLKDHLFSDAPVRYSNSCRDITSRIPQEFVAMHAAISSTVIKNFAADKNAVARICRIDQTAMGVTVINVPICNMRSIEVQGWKIFISEQLLQLINKARNEKLPNETGGILMGGIDFLYRKIYLVDTILSPKDSEETPVSYIRGIEGVEEKLNNIEKTTSGNLAYAGEWHSHPPGCSLDMSEDDKILFAEICGNMSAIGFPGLMLIAGEDLNVKIYLNEEMS